MPSAVMTADRPLARILATLKQVKESRGSWTALCPAHEDDTPSLSIATGRDGRVLLRCHAGCTPAAIVGAVGLTMSDLFPARAAMIHGNGNGKPAANVADSRPRLIKTYDYTDEDGTVLYQACRFVKPNGKKTFRQRRPGRDGDWIWSVDGVRLVPYRLPQIIEAAAEERTIYVVEGEKDADTLAELGLTATTNPMGAGKWRDEFSAVLSGADVVILPDNDAPGRVHAAAVAASLEHAGARVRTLELPGLPPKGDVSDWLAGGHTRGELEHLALTATATRLGESAPGIAVDDFYAVMPEHSYLFVPTRQLWPAASVNARIAPIQEGRATLKASSWLDGHRPVEQLTWAPGEPTVIPDRLISDGGWIGRVGCACFNLYREPIRDPGDPSAAEPWLEHLHRVYPDDAVHIARWLAHRVQRPGEKLNHALVLGGAQGIGKDTLLEPAKYAVGPWNFVEASPAHLLGRFNGFVKSIILRVSEARDLGDVDRYAFYEHLKTLTAAPPDVLRVDEKNLREYAVMNVCGVIITSNHKTDGIYLPADDRRHFVAWSERSSADFAADYWQQLYRWYSAGGKQHVAAYLATMDLSSFDAKAPPPKTPAFWDIVNANRAPEDAELADALDRLGRPAATTLSDIAREADGAFGDWLRDRKNGRKIPHRLEAAGYVPFRNEGASDGLWKVGGKRQVVYARSELSLRDRAIAVQMLSEARCAL